MKFREIANCLTGISTPIFGIQWNPPGAEITKTRRVISFLEDRRILYNPDSLEVPSHCVRSVIKIREFLTSELSSTASETELTQALRAMRAACRKFLDSTDHGDVIEFARQPGHWATWRFYPALGEMRGVFGIYIAILAVRYGIDLEDNLASVIPIGEGRIITDGGE